MTTTLPLDDLALDQRVLPSPVIVRASLRGRFLKGPIHWDWIASAAALPGRALHVGMALWLEAGLRQSLTVKVCHARLREMGVDRYAARRALRELERKGLLSVVERRAGRSPVVRLVTSAEFSSRYIAVKNPG